MNEISFPSAESVTGKEGDRMRIGFVGAGKVGVTLGRYFTEHHTDVSGYYSRNSFTARQASEFTHTRYYETLEDIAASSDALFLTVPDGAIEEVWNSLKRYSLTGKLICHCSGAMSSAVFSGISRMGAFGYSIHPLFAISSKQNSYKEISQAYFTIEGDGAYLDFWKSFFEKLGNPVRVIRPEDKVLYHSAAVFVSNLVTGLYEAGVVLLMSCGFDRKSAEAALAPLFVNNARGVAQNGTAAALTGPVERADVMTVREHLEALPEEEREIYLRISAKLLEIARRKDPERDYGELSQILERNGK